MSRIRSIALLSLLTPLFPQFATAETWQPREKYTLQWTADLPLSSRGYGVGLLPKNGASTQPATMPSVQSGASRAEVDQAISAGALGIGFKTFNPPSTNPFDANGNIYDRPQREVSVMFGGRQIENRVSPAGLGMPATQPTTRPAPAAMTLTLEFAVGGAYLTLAAGDKVAFDRSFVPGVMPSDISPHFVGDAAITAVHAEWAGEVLPPAEPPTQVKAFAGELIDNDHHTASKAVDFPQSTDDIGRVIATFELAKTPAGIDKWDRIGQVYLVDSAGQRFELFRFMTPYHREWTWQCDVTDLLPLLRGKQTLELDCVTYGPGWLATVNFDFYKGPLSPRPFRVTNIWDKAVIIGQANQPVDKQLPPTPLQIDPSTTVVKLRTIVTGHGGLPNTRNAGEFLPLGRRVHVGESVFQNLLWTTDNYLNPLHPQGGTWKYDRAGWGPGRLVTPWTIDITKAVKSAATQPAMLSYEIQPYENKTPDKGYPAQHRVTAELIEFR